jgi:hypothetical protein
LTCHGSIDQYKTSFAFLLCDTLSTETYRKVQRLFISISPFMLLLPGALGCTLSQYRFSSLRYDLFKL